MEDALAALTERGPAALGLLGTTGAGLLASLLGIALGVRALRAPGKPELALAAAVALALPLVGVLLGFRASRPDLPETAVPLTLALVRFRAGLQLREAAALAGLLLALPVGVSSCLWAGIASARRSRRAGERARLSAVAAGQPAAGELVAMALDRSRAPRLGAAVGAFGALLVVGAPCLGALVSSRLLLAAQPQLATLGGAAPSFLRIALAEAADPVRLGTLAGAVGAIVVGLLLGALLHVGSSRRRNLAVALKALQALGADKAGLAAVTSALSATGKPRATGPALVAVALAAAAGLALAQAAALRAEWRVTPEAVATGR